MDNDRHPTIAIVGAAGIFPGAGDLTRFWHNIVALQSAIHPVPPKRWPMAPAHIYSATSKPDKARSLNAGLIRGFSFNPEGYALPAEATIHLDPMHHLVLETGRSAWQDSRNDAVDPDRVDVILAAIALPTEAASRLTRKVLVQACEEKLFGKKTERQPVALSAQDAMAGCVTSFPAALLGAALNLGGGTQTLDAACASSLFAVKLACDALQAGRADAVLAGGVARPDILYTQIGFTQLQALSLSGHCAPFDRSADGLVVGEGCGMLVLKRLEDALQHGDHIYAVIRGAGLSNDMRGNLLAPDSEGQLRAMQMAYAAAGWSPSDVDLIECHGAATPVGDATELRSLTSLWDQADWRPGQCAIGSIKSMIGHLLTAAGAAGLIKVLLGLRHQTLPPSLNFKEAAPDSPLHDSPFHVQTHAAPWHRRDADTPRRAAVSAFGFGGINAHVLLEEWPPPSEQAPSPVTVSRDTHSRKSAPTAEPIAVVGMEALFGPAHGLKAFQEAIFKGLPLFQPPSDQRWKNCGNHVQRYFQNANPLYGAYLDEFQIDLAEFRIPPKEIPDILPQHLLMLKVALTAMDDAGLAANTERPRMGCVIGMEFDLEDTNFHLRWDTRQVAQQWNMRYALGLTPDQINIWAQELADAYAPPLTHTRTLGSLGGLIASRVARELRFGGPSFIVSDDAASGLKALSAAVGMLQRQEVDSMLVGAVDLPGDLRRIIRTDRLRPYTRNAFPHCLDQRADGSLPGDGAAALVIKRLKDARNDGDRIYAVIRGLGTARRGHPFRSEGMAEAVSRALTASLDEAQIPPETIGYIEAHGSGHYAEDQAEYRALKSVFASQAAPLALGAMKACLGHAGAAAGLASLVKTALCLYQQILPAMPHYQAPPETVVLPDHIHMPTRPVFWPTNRTAGPRRACLNALTGEGNAMSVVMEEAPEAAPGPGDTRPMSPAGVPAHGLFVVAADNHGQLETGLDQLLSHLRQSRATGKSIGIAALEWFHRHRESRALPCALAFSLAGYRDFEKYHQDACNTVRRGTALALDGPTGGHFSPRPLGPSHQPTLVYPGSGNHYVGMGRQLSVQWPQIWRNANQSTDRFADQCRSASLVPYRSQWQPGWRSESLTSINADPITTIYGQVVYGCLMTDLLRYFGIKPSAVIGYSLGETVGYFATGAWPDRGHMLERLETSDLFHTQLAGPCLAARQALPIPADAPVAWRVAVVNRPAALVREKLVDFPTVRLLITNSPNESVIGGHGPAVESAIRHMACEAVYLEGVVAVHCETVNPVSDAYRTLHLFPTTPSPGIAYYSCAAERRIDLTSETAADALLKQAIHGFDFPATIKQAHADGIRLFLEVGPQGSCTRMIHQILKDAPHRALSVAPDTANEVAGISRTLAILAAERLPMRLDRFFPPAEVVAVSLEDPSTKRPSRPMTIACGGMPLNPPQPESAMATGQPSTAEAFPPETGSQSENGHAEHPAANTGSPTTGELFFDQTRTLIREMTDSMAATSETHKQFLSFTEDLSRQYAQTVDLQTRLIHQAHREGLLTETPPQPPSPSTPVVAFDRAMCMEFAVGSVAKVLGPAFAAVDHYPARVRLPDEPLMLVDRILSVEGEKGVLGPGRLVTEHDVLPDAWYLDGDRAPVCISVEAGQADLFLSAYLGIDLEVKGERTYRLLDASVAFHRGLPRPGETIRYAIEIEKFIRQGPTWLFFFRFDGSIDGQPLITMRNGCAGFFTAAEVQNSGGIILTEDDRKPRTGVLPDNWTPLVPMTREAYDRSGLEALRRGDLARCFGAPFSGIKLPETQRLPGGRMALIDRVLSLDPDGGRYGLGLIRAEADIHPDDWFLTCHFVDDMVMPGTLMYECCAHTLRIYLQRMGWISDRPGVVYEPVIGRQAVLKCRGPVTPATRQVVYEVEISELGFNPEPYVIADAHMYADGHRIVMFQSMTMKMTGVDRRELENFWNARQTTDPSPRRETDSPSSLNVEFSREQLIEFATGLPSKAFGPPYRPFDHERFIARLPGPPYAFIDRVTRIEPPPWVLAPDGWVETVCAIGPEDWYFRSNNAPFMPICILMEIALQACGFLAAYMGSALHSTKDLHFRNLDGRATLHANVRSTAGPLHTRARLLKHSAAGDMLIEHYAFEVRQDGQPIYEGQTSFGFFTPASLAQQVGLPEADQPIAATLPPTTVNRRSILLEDMAPLTPDDPAALTLRAACDAFPCLAHDRRHRPFRTRRRSRGPGICPGDKNHRSAGMVFQGPFFPGPGLSRFPGHRVLPSIAALCGAGLLAALFPIPHDGAAGPRPPYLALPGPDSALQPAGRGRSHDHRAARCAGALTQSRWLLEM